MGYNNKSRKQMKNVKKNMKKGGGEYMDECARIANEGTREEYEQKECEGKDKIGAWSVKHPAWERTPKGQKEREEYLKTPDGIKELDEKIYDRLENHEQARVCSDIGDSLEKNVNYNIYTDDGKRTYKLKGKYTTEADYNKFGCPTLKYGYGVQVGPWEKQPRGKKDVQKKMNEMDRDDERSTGGKKKASKKKTAKKKKATKKKATKKKKAAKKKKTKKAAKKGKK